MKRIIYICTALYVIFSMASCEKETEGMSKTLYFELQGEKTMLVSVGTSYQDPGFKITLDGQDVSGHVEVSGNVDAQTVGLYPVEYIYTNKDGVKTFQERTVIVCDPSVTTNMAGSYITAEGTYRKAASGEVPYPGFKVNIYRIAPGFFEISDFLGGYYHQRAGYGAAYACSGYVQLKSDNTFSLLSSSILPWNDTVESVTGGTYDPTTGAVSWCSAYAGMLFNVVLN